MNEKTEHLRLKSLVTKDEIGRVQRYATPDIAANQIINLAVESGAAKACALIDSLDPLTAAFIILELRLRDYFKGPAKDVLDLAKKLHIQGLKGLCHARDQVYKQTGAFLV